MLIPTLRPDLQAKAVELEHAMFRNAKAANLYKASVLKKVGAGQGILLGWGGETAPPASQAVCLPLPGGLTSLPGQLEVFPASPVRTRTWPVSSYLQPQVPETHFGKPGLGLSGASGCHGVPACR